LRKSDEEAARTRARIVETAAQHLKQTGVANTSLADIMSAAGLTHGGFYRHFRSKEHLVAEALGEAASKSGAAMRANVRRGGTAAAAQSYLSAAHRDARTPVCPFAAFGSEIRNAGDEVKGAASTSVESLISALGGAETLVGNERREVIASLAVMVGAMVLARSVSDEGLSDEILASAQQFLKKEARRI
jgi:TetR/AcrR family transcriptional regulator, transcriptional repressor for nem operon